MHFIRLAGCSVGKLPTNDPRSSTQSVFPVLKTYNTAWECRTYDGRPFWCDTDFKFREWTNFSNLLDDTWERHICITGGEPLIHAEKLHRFIAEARDNAIEIHIETSGTIMWNGTGDLWISVSPKKDVLPDMVRLADEIKLLVDEGFDISNVPDVVRAHGCVYVQPINDELTINKENFDRCMAILHVMPHWHMSVQLHKLVGLR